VTKGEQLRHRELGRGHSDWSGDHSAMWRNATMQDGLSDQERSGEACRQAGSEEVPSKWMALFLTLIVGYPFAAMGVYEIVNGLSDFGRFSTRRYQVEIPGRAGEQWPQHRFRPSRGSNLACRCSWARSWPPWESFSGVTPWLKAGAAPPGSRRDSSLARCRHLYRLALRVGGAQAI